LNRPDTREALGEEENIMAIRAGRSVVAAAFTIAALLAGATLAVGDDAQVARGKYLVSVIGCTDCHTPGSMLGKPDMSKFLGGSDVAFVVPGLGAFVPPNLTPDNETGLGKWTIDQIITAFTKGIDDEGRHLAPIMPYMNFANLTPEDATAVAMYLKSLPPVSNKVHEPFGPDDKVTMLTMAVAPGSGMAGN
jgi:mono/diheme cytochrome c family protein